jgi:hypothetical protein
MNVILDWIVFRSIHLTSASAVGDPDLESGNWGIRSVDGRDWGIWGYFYGLVGFGLWVVDLALSSRRRPP